jgi:hypothetical protein
MPQDDRDDGRKHRPEETEESKNKAGDGEVHRGELRYEPTATVKTGWGGVSHGRSHPATEQVLLQSHEARRLQRVCSRTIS